MVWNMQKDKRFDFRVSVQEKADIRDLADLHGMNVSAYLREMALGYEPISLIDIEKVEQLIQKNSELSRLGNLLKIWLFDDPRLQMATRMKIENKLPEILDAIHEQRLSIRELVSEMSNNLVTSRERCGRILR